MSFNSNALLDQMVTIYDTAKSAQLYVNNGYLKRNYESIFLGEPDKSAMDVILEYGGVIIDHRVQHGVLFGVPKEWILDDDTELPADLFDVSAKGHARLLILDVNPIIVYTIYNEKVYEDELYGEDFVECHTHCSRSLVALPIVKDRLSNL